MCLCAIMHRKVDHTCQFFSTIFVGPLFVEFWKLRYHGNETLRFLLSVRARSLSYFDRYTFSHPSNNFKSLKHFHQKQIQFLFLKGLLIASSSSTNSAPTRGPVNRPILYLCGHFKKGHSYGNSCHEFVKTTRTLSARTASTRGSHEEFRVFSILGIFEVLMNPHARLHLSPVISLTVNGYI